jgi:lipopolysaccharide export system permease protein
VAKFDRYVLAQLLVLFGFFALILVAVFWINRAVVLFDRLIGDGQSALVFAEFTALGLPKLIFSILPIASFCAAAYVTNRLSNESELVVMQATGSSPWRLARPYLIFAAIVILMASVLSHFLQPLATAQLNLRESEVSRNVTARLLTEGTFLHPTKGITFYTREIGSDGVLRDVFMSDRRNKAEGIIYSASEAYLVQIDQASTLIMVNGLAQRLDVAGNRLSTARFRDFSFDISNLVRRGPAQGKALSHMTTDQLVQVPNSGPRSEEFHSRIARPLFAGVAALVGFSALLIGGFSRFGVWREITIAFGLLLVLDGLRGALQSNLQTDPGAWPLAYLPSALGIALILAMLTHASAPHWTLRKIRVRT